jgi:hypothetical protein
VVGAGLFNDRIAIIDIMLVAKQGNQRRTDKMAHASNPTPRKLQIYYSTA